MQVEIYIEQHYNNCQDTIVSHMFGTKRSRKPIPTKCEIKIIGFGKQKECDELSNVVMDYVKGLENKI